MNQYEDELENNHVDYNELPGGATGAEDFRMPSHDKLGGGGPDNKDRRTEESPIEKVQKKAAEYGIILDEKRLKRFEDILNLLEIDKNVFFRPGIFSDRDNGNLRIENDRQQSEDSDDELETVSFNRWGTNESVAKIDFTPEAPEIVNGVAEYVANPGNASRIGLMLIQGLQNYCLLVDSGCMDPRDVLAGKTNEEMARTCRNLFGFKEFDEDVVQGRRKVYIKAPYTTVRDRVFSERIRVLEEKMSERLKPAQSESKTQSGQETMPK